MAFDLVLDGKDAEHVEVRNGVLIHQPVDKPAARKLELTHAQLVAAITKKPQESALPADAAQRLDAFLALVEAPKGTFGLVTPKP
jgi:hypothetical protein